MSMILGIMQPYFLPYLGYYQLFNLADQFVVYDNVKYTKKGWINRNRILDHGKDKYITLPLSKDSDHLNIDQRYLSETFDQSKEKILRRIWANYHKAACFEEVFRLLEEILNFPDHNLFNFIFNALKLTGIYLEIHTELIISSTIPIDHSLKAEDKVLAICRQLKAERYINPIGGVELYSKERFDKYNIDLKFLKTKSIPYSQISNEFIPNLSILDVMMFNDKAKIRDMLNDEYILIG